MAQVKKNAAKKTTGSPAVSKVKSGKKGVSQKRTLFINTFSGQVTLVFVSIASIVLLPTTMLLMVGMLPTFAAFLVGGRKGYGRAYCVAATNFVGCYLFILQLWSAGHTFNSSMLLISNPMNIIVMYCAASIGYFLDWVLSGMTVSVIQQRAKNRLSKIRDRQQALTDQWGPKVTGSIPLDEEGFPIVKE